MGRRQRPLHEDYMIRAHLRRKALQTLFDVGAHADAVRETQELVELALKALLRKVGIEPPKWHDVGAILEENDDLLPDALRAELPRIRAFSAALRKDREMSFYGEDDFLPSENYDATHSSAALSECDWLLALVTPFVLPGNQPP